MSMWETPETPTGPAGGDDIALTTPANADVPELRAAAGDTCPTCGGPPGPGKTGRCAACRPPVSFWIWHTFGEAWRRLGRVAMRAIP